MRHAAADGAAVADLVMRDMRDRRLQQRMRGRKPRVVQDVAPAHHGAEADAVGADPDLSQFFQLAQVDQQLRRGDAERQHRHQALAAGDHLGVAVLRGEQLHGFGERGRAGVVERRQFHVIGSLPSALPTAMGQRRALLASAISCHTRDGDSGNSRGSTPSEDERVGDRVRDHAADRNDAALARALGAERIVRRGLVLQRDGADAAGSCPPSASGSRRANRSGAGRSRHRRDAPAARRRAPARWRRPSGRAA